MLLGGFSTSPFYFRSQKERPKQKHGTSRGDRMREERKERGSERGKRGRERAGVRGREKGEKRKCPPPAPPLPPSTTPPLIHTHTSHIPHPTRPSCRPSLSFPVHLLHSLPCLFFIPVNPCLSLLLVPPCRSGTFSSVGLFLWRCSTVRNQVCASGYSLFILKERGH